MNSFFFLKQYYIIKSEKIEKNVIYVNIYLKQLRIIRVNYNNYFQIIWNVFFVILTVKANSLHFNQQSKIISEQEFQTFFKSLHMHLDN